MPDRKPNPQAAEASRTIGGATPAGEAILCLRVQRTGEPADSFAALWQAGHPLAWLIADIVQAAGGEPVLSQKGPFTATFSALQDAICTALRLQWAMQGFAPAGNPTHWTLAILVGAREEFPGLLEEGRLPAAIEWAVPGAILLAPLAAATLQEQGGYILTASQEAGWQFLRGGSAPDQGSAEADEYTLDALIAEKGLEFADGYKREAATAEAVERIEMAPPPAAPVPQHSPASPSRLDMPAAWSVPGKMAWLLGGAGLLLVIVIAFFVIHRAENRAPRRPIAEAGGNLSSPSSAGGSASNLAEPVPQSHSPAAQQTDQPVASVGGASTPAGAAEKKLSARDAKEQEKKLKAQASKSDSESKIAPLPRGRCELDPSEVGGQIELAEKNLARGKYKDARRQFESALACEPANGRAREGLIRVRQAESAEGPDANN